MNDATLQAFRDIAAAMHGSEPQTWQWIGRWASQRMFGISERRAKECAERHGGRAEPMPATLEVFNRRGEPVRVTVPEGD